MASGEPQNRRKGEKVALRRGATVEPVEPERARRRFTTETRRHGEEGETGSPPRAASPPVAQRRSAAQAEARATPPSSSGTAVRDRFGDFFNQMNSLRL